MHFSFPFSFRLTQNQQISMTTSQEKKPAGPTKARKKKREKEKKRKEKERKKKKEKERKKKGTDTVTITAPAILFNDPITPDIVVAKDGSGNYTKIQVRAAHCSHCMFWVTRCVHRLQVSIQCSTVTLLGCTSISIWKQQRK